MHLAHPAFTTTGKKKGPRKFRNSEAAQKAREQEDSWKELLKRHGVEQEDKRKSRAMSAPVWNPPPRSYRGSDQPRIPSKDTGVGVAVKAPEKVYTGTSIVGIATMHKSNAVPVFCAEDAIEISKMRR